VPFVDFQAGSGVLRKFAAFVPWKAGGLLQWVNHQKKFPQCFSRYLHQNGEIETISCDWRTLFH